MGLAGFYQLIKKQGYLPGCVTLGSLRGKTVAIDGDFVLYQALLGHTSGSDVKAEEVSKPIINWLDLAKKAGITTIFVTTGGPSPIEKQNHCGVVRKRKRERQQEKIQELVELLPTLSEDIGEELCTREKICRMQNSIRRVTSTMSTQVVDILRADGWNCVQAKSEADFLLVMLSEDEKCHFVATDDADIIVAGASHVLRGFTRLLTTSSETAQDYCRTDIMARLEMNHECFLEFGSLLACDYNPQICNVGPMTAFRMIQKYGSVDKFVRSDAFTVETKNKKRKYTLPAGMTPDVYIQASARAVEIFLSRPDRSGSK